MTKYDTGDMVGNFVLGFVIGVVILAFILIMSGVFNPMVYKLDIDFDKLTSEYIIQYYPEFKDCKILYENNIYRGESNSQIKSGAVVYCDDSLDNRDSLKIKGEGEPTERIEFDGITLQDILELKLQDVKK